MSRQYSFVKLNEFYFCLQQSPVSLAHILFFKRDELLSTQPWLKKSYAPWSTSYFRYHWKLFKNNLRTLIYFVWCKFVALNVDSVSLPVYGQFGMSVHKGYKIFNLRSGVVAKIFDSDMDKTSILKEIEQMKKVAQMDFAPSIREWNVDEMWYQESYIRSDMSSAHRSADSGAFLKAFYREAMPCMNSLILFQPPLTKDLSVYLKELIGILDGSRLSGMSSNLREANIFRDFVYFISERLNAEVSRPVCLVFSHGDFCPANILNTKDGLRIVDWETIGFRSLLFDFYSYFFYRITSGNLPVDKVVSEINEALPIFVSGLSLSPPHITGNLLAFVKIYRQLYYVEYLCKLVERDLTDNRLNMVDYIMRYVEAFSEYEAILNVNVITDHNVASTYSY